MDESRERSQTASRLTGLRPGQAAHATRACPWPKPAPEEPPCPLASRSASAKKPASVARAGACGASERVSRSSVFSRCLPTLPRSHALPIPAALPFAAVKPLARSLFSAIPSSKSFRCPLACLAGLLFPLGQGTRTRLRFASAYDKRRSSALRHRVTTKPLHQRR